jgi:hypothetical protein
MVELSEQQFIDQIACPPIGGCSVPPLNGPIARITPDRAGEILISCQQRSTLSATTLAEPR